MKTNNNPSNILTVNPKFDISYYILTNLNKVEKCMMPTKIGLRLTDDCNLCCPHCFVSKKHNYIKIEDVEYILNKLDQAPLEIYLTGGEPTLHPNFYDIVSLIYARGILIKLHTNGIYNETTLQTIIQSLSMINSIQISIDSITKFNILRPNKTTGSSLSSIDRFLKTLSKLGFSSISINTVVSKDNIDDLDQIIDYGIERGVKQFRLSPIFTNLDNLMVEDDNSYNIFKNLVNKYSASSVNFLSDPLCHPWSYYHLYKNIDVNAPLFCPAQKTECEIDMFGNVYPCPFLHNSDHLMGNIFSEDFETIWNNGVSALTKSKWSQDPKCQSCPLYTACGGGCYASAYHKNIQHDARCAIYEA